MENTKSLENRPYPFAGRTVIDFLCASIYCRQATPQQGLLHQGAYGLWKGLLHRGLLPWSPARNLMSSEICESHSPAGRFRLDIPGRTAMIMLGVDFVNAAAQR